jgi:Inner membrane protein YgaP-like, transmembrane domain
MALIQFMSGAAGRIARAIAGVVLVGLGLFVIQGALGWVVALVGLLPLAAGTFDFCLLDALFGIPLKGRDARASHGKTATAGR